MRKSIKKINKSLTHIIKPRIEESSMSLSADVIAYPNIVYMISFINVSTSYMQKMLDVFSGRIKSQVFILRREYIYSTPRQHCPSFTYTMYLQTEHTPLLLNCITSKGNIILISCSTYCRANFLLAGIFLLIESKMHKIGDSGPSASNIPNRQVEKRICRKEILKKKVGSRLQDHENACPCNTVAAQCSICCLITHNAFPSTCPTTTALPDSQIVAAQAWPDEGVCYHHTILPLGLCSRFPHLPLLRNSFSGGQKWLNTLLQFSQLQKHISVWFHDLLSVIPQKNAIIWMYCIEGYCVLRKMLLCKWLRRLMCVLLW